MSSIWGSDAGGVWRPLTPSQYPAEQVLHDLVEQAPQMLPLAGSPQLTVLGREVQLGAGRADLLAVESSGRLAIIEIKLAGNAEARRAVVAQVLSYAAYLQGLTPERLESDVLGSHLQKRGTASIAAAVEAADQQGALDPPAFTDGLALSLAEGGFRLVFVLDSTPDELVQLVGYLQLLTDRIVVDLVTVSTYEVNGARILVPQRVEPARRFAELSDAEAVARQVNALQPGAEAFRLVIADAPDDQQPLLNRLAGWAEGLQRERLVTLATFRGKAGRTTLLPRLLGEDAGLVTVYADRGQAYLQFWRTVFERRAPVCLPRVEAILGSTLKQGNTAREVTDELLAVLTDAYREATNPTRTRPASRS
jgi:hypothetical protein